MFKEQTDGRMDRWTHDVSSLAYSQGGLKNPYPTGPYATELKTRGPLSLQWLELLELTITSLQNNNIFDKSKFKGFADKKNTCNSKIEIYFGNDRKH